MSLFGIGKTKSFLGVDIGAAGIKLVDFREDRNRCRLHTYAWSEMPPEQASKNPLDNTAALGGLVREMVKKSRAESRRAVTGLPISSVFSSVLSVPFLSEKEQRGAIEVQARKLISVPLEELILDTKIITPPEELAKKGSAAPKNIHALLTAAPKALVSKYLAVFREAGLELASLETEAFALIRSLVGRDKSAQLIIDLGAHRTSVLVVDGGIPFLSRSIDVGGYKMTKAAADALGVPEDQAEAMKADFRMMGASANGAMPPVFEPLLNQIVTEVNFSLKLYAGLDGTGPDKPKMVEKAIITGGGSLLPGIDSYFAQKLNLRVFRGDPWARVLYPDDLRPTLDEIGPRFSVAVGLAMREFE